MTKYNPNIHHRRSIRLRNYDYSQEGLYFVTICVQNKECLFGKIVDGEMRLNESGEIAQRCWVEIPQHYQNVVLNEFVVMPNHLHGIIEITTPVGAEYFPPAFPPENTGNENRVENIGVENIRPLRPNCESGSLGAIVRGFKIGVTKQLGYSVWQRNYYEHIIRDQNSHARIAEYIINNSINWETDKFYNAHCKKIKS